MSFMLIKEGAQIIVHDSSSLRSAWRQYGKMPEILLVEKFVCKGFKPTPAQVRRMARELREKLVFA